LLFKILYAFIKSFTNGEAFYYLQLNNEINLLKLFIILNQCRLVGVFFVNLSGLVSLCQENISH